MIYVICIILKFTLASVVWADGISLDLGPEDCKQFKGIGEATQGFIGLISDLEISGQKREIKETKRPPNLDRGCRLVVNENKGHVTNTKRIGFGNASIYIIVDPGRVRVLKNFVGRRGILSSKKLVKNVSLNEKQFDSPVLRVDCASTNEACEIIVSPSMH